MKTMAYVVADRVHVACHKPVAPSNEEWETYLSHIEKYLNRIDGIFVFAPDAGPTLAQQRAASAFWKRAPVNPPIVILTTSRLVARAAGALKWFMPSQIRALGVWDSDKAAEHLQLDEQRYGRALRTLRSLALQLDVTIPDELS